jgi:hypothetical protein
VDAGTNGFHGDYQGQSIQQMPTALRSGPYRVYFYSYDCGEARHMHVDRDNLSAKFWVDPNIQLADNHGYKRHGLRRIERLLRDYLQLLRETWDEFCNPDNNAGAI